MREKSPIAEYRGVRRSLFFDRGVVESISWSRGVVESWSRGVDFGKFLLGSPTSLSRLHDFTQSTPRLRSVDSTTSLSRLHDFTQSTPRLHSLDSIENRLYDSIESTPRLHSVDSTTPRFNSVDSHCYTGITSEK